MKFGLTYSNTGPYSTPDGARDLALAAEMAGFESLWTVEHVVVPAGYESRYPYSRSGRMARGIEDFDIPDPLVWLAYAGAVTTEIRLGTGGLILPLHDPLVLAKSAASVDHLTGGRLLLGVGSGWLEEEFDALGRDFANRGERMDEAIAVLRTLWTEERASFAGEFTSFPDLYLRPRPVQRPIPIVIGGHSRRAARRAGELGDGFFPAGADRERIVGLWQEARGHAERAGRDPGALELTLGGRPDPADVELLAGYGASRIVFGLMSIEQIEIAGDELLPEYV